MSITHKARCIAQEKRIVLGFIAFAQAAVREELRAGRVPPFVIVGGLQTAVAWRDAVERARAGGRVFEWLPSWRVTLEEMKDIAAQLDSVLCAIKADYKLR